MNVLVEIILNKTINFLLALLLLVLCFLYHYFKLKKYSFEVVKIFLFSFFIFTTVMIIDDIFYFLYSESREILKNLSTKPFEILIFNLTIAFYAFSIILHLLTLIELRKKDIKLTIPSKIEAKRGEINIGKVVDGNKDKYTFKLSLNDLEKHMFICGATGTGKSNFLQNLLINFNHNFNFPFLLVEFKGEYHFLQSILENLLILWPGINFSINIFNPLESDPDIHAERTFDILKSGQFFAETSEFSPQMEKVLVEILSDVCKDPNKRNWSGFEHYCEKYLTNKMNDIPMLNQTLISIKNRIRRYSNGPLKILFEKHNTIDFENIFNQRILLDLSSIIRLGGEKKDIFFFLNMLLKYLWDNNLSKGSYSYNGISHFTIVEDAQYFAPQSSLNSNKLTSYLEDIALLQRGTGECLITLSTRPSISKEILANNGIVLSFKNHFEKDIMCELLNLREENKHYLSILNKGECIIRINSIKKPFLLSIPYIRRGKYEVSEIIKNNKNTLSKNNQRKIVFVKKKKNFLASNKIYRKILKFLKKNFSSFSFLNRKKPRLLDEKTLIDLKSPKYKSENNIDIFEKSGFIDITKNNYMNVQYKKISLLLQNQNYKEVIKKCITFIENIFKYIGNKSNMDYDNLERFYYQIKKNEKEFVLFFELKYFINFLKAPPHNYNSIDLKANDIFSLTKKILKKIAYNNRNKLRFAHKKNYVRNQTISPGIMKNGTDIISKNHEKDYLIKLNNFIGKLVNSDD